MDWSADRPAVIEPALHGPVKLAGLLRIACDDGGIRKGQAGIECLIYQVDVAATVELVRSRLHGVVEKPASGLAIFRREIAGLDGNLLDSVHATLADLRILAPSAVGRVLALDADSLSGGWKSIDAETGIGRENDSGKELRDG